VTNGVRISRAASAMQGYPSMWWHKKLESVVPNTIVFVECGSAGVLYSIISSK